MDEIVILAPAKLNLTLDIVGKRTDGYHLLETVMQSITLFDRVILRRAKRGINLSCSDKTIPTDHTNIAVKAATAFFNATNCHFGVDINIEKHIPCEAGLGGGSADGAAVLIGLNQLAQTGLTKAQLAEISVGVGADIPFCIYQNTALVQGIGEHITPIKKLAHCYFVVAKPPIGISTKQAFALVDALETANSSTKKMLEAIESGSAKEVATRLSNRFMQVGCPSEVNELQQAMLDSGADGAMMTGSGSAVFSVFTTFEKATECKAFLQQKFPDSQVFIAEPYFTE